MAAAALTELIFSTFGISIDEGALDQANYLIGMTNEADVREWIVHAFELSDTDTRIGEFVANWGNIVHNKGPSHRSDAETASQSGPAVSELFSSTKQTTKSVPTLLFKDDDPSRVSCSCLARLHALLGNCLKCGKIFCQQEGYGKCLCCGERERLHWAVGNVAVHASASPDQIEAVAQKNKLVQFDKEQNSRTKVFDDSTDWFAETGDVWKGRKERDRVKKLATEFEEKKLAAQREMKIEIDFASGKLHVLDKASEIEKVDIESRKELNEMIDKGKKIDTGRGSDEPHYSQLDEASAQLLLELLSDYQRVSYERVSLPRSILSD